MGAAWRISVQGASRCLCPGATRSRLFPAAAPRMKGHMSDEQMIKFECCHIAQPIETPSEMLQMEPTKDEY
jgi:hypothetical protein